MPEPALQKPLPEEEQYVELMPAEKKLIGWSLGLGIVLLAILILASRSLS
ncbi:hypothetical protein [Desulfofundulus thermosubterraneus]|uniref:Uncharacterized protein n=1 Tax=Desulfofundulus thermosubterraneus DSM 16057 TaxID=1121432 RepID=A0A1M6AK33_9FIRM|nr:hypothetical protein [Desulfofundulus thermosubterraneus]SHI36869.1 hypothetical protein SAMN02745219_00177 [Desulfofundulus thermosubterraneus DSM 16057]